MREARRVFMAGLAHLTLNHCVRHSRQVMTFVVQNYPYPVFLEPDSTLAVSVLRAYRRCCCNAWIYRILRFGATPLWHRTAANVVAVVPTDDDDSYFRRLGRSFAAKRVTPDLQWEIALLLLHQFFVFPFSRHDASSQPSQVDGSSDSIMVALDVDTLSSDRFNECIHDQFHAGYASVDATVVSYGAREFERGLLAAIESESVDLLRPSYRWLHDAVPSATPGHSLLNALVELAIEKIRVSPDRDELVRIPRWAWLQELEQVVSVIDQLALAVSDTLSHSDPSVSVLFVESSLRSVLRAIRDASLDGVEELALCLRMLQHCCRDDGAVATLVRDSDLLVALASRLCRQGVRSRGWASCQCTLGFVRVLVSQIESVQTKQLLCASQSFVWSVVELLDVDFDNLVAVAVAKDCLTVLRMLSRPSIECDSDTVEVAAAQQLLDTVELGRHGFSGPSESQDVAELGPDIDAGSTKSWVQLLTQYLISDQRGIGCVAPSLDILYWLLLADPAMVTAKCLSHGALPVVVNLMTSSDAGIQDRAVAFLCEVNRSAQRTNDPRPVAAIAAIVIGSQRPYVDGLRVPVRMVRESPSRNESALAKRDRADQDLVLALLSRLALFSQIATTDLVMLSQTVVPVRFRRGDAILADPARLGIFVVASGCVEWTLETQSPSAGSARARSVVSVLVKGCAFGCYASNVLKVASDAVREHATATDDGTCVWIPSRVWTAPESASETRIGAAVRNTVARSSSVVFHVARARRPPPTLVALSSESLFGKMTLLAAREAVSDTAVVGASSSSVVLLVALCRQFRRSSSLVGKSEQWVLRELFDLLSHDATPLELRLEILLVVQDAAESSNDVASSVLTKWRYDGGCAGLVSFVTMFDTCILDRQSLHAWLQCTACLVNAPARPLDKTLVRTLSDPALRRLLAVVVEWPWEAPFADSLPWCALPILECLTHSQDGRRRIANCLDATERSALLAVLLRLLEAWDSPPSSSSSLTQPAPLVPVSDPDKKTALLGVLVNLSRHASFQLSLSSLPEWVNAIDARLTQLLQLARECRDDASSRPSLSLLEPLGNVVGSAASPIVTKARVVEWIDDYFIQHVRSLVQSLDPRHARDVTDFVSALRHLILSLRVLSRSSMRALSTLHQCVDASWAGLCVVFALSCDDNSSSARETVRTELLRGLQALLECGAAAHAAWASRVDQLDDLLHTLHSELRECPHLLLIGTQACERQCRYVVSTLSAVTDTLAIVASTSSTSTARSIQSRLENLLAFTVESVATADAWILDNNTHCRVPYSMLVLLRSLVVATTRLRQYRTSTEAGNTTSRSVREVLAKRLAGDVLGLRQGRRYRAGAVRLAATCVVEVVRDRDFVSSLAGSTGTELLQLLVDSLESRTALRGKLRALRYLCRVQLASSASSSRVVVDSAWAGAFGRSLVTSLDATGRTLCDLAKLLRVLVASLGAVSLALVSVRDVEAVVERLLTLTTDDNESKRANSQQSRTIAGLRAVVALVQGYESQINDRFISSCTSAALQTARHLGMQPSASAFDASLFQLCLTTVRDLHEDARYATAVAATLATNADAIVAWPPVFREMHSRDATFRVAVYDVVAIAVRASGGEAKRSLQIDVAGAMEWGDYLLQGATAERTRVAQCVHLLVHGNDIVQQSSQAQLAPAILACLAGFVAPFVAKLAGPHQDATRWRDVCDLIASLCATLRDLVLVDASARPYATSQDCAASVEVVVSILGCLASFTHTPGAPWSEESTRTWTVALTSTLAFVHAALKSRADLSVVVASRPLLSAALFVAVNAHSAGDRVVQLAVTALERVLRVSTAWHRQNNNSKREYQQRCEELLDEHTAVLLVYADFQSSNVRLQPLVRFSSLRLLHALSIGASRPRLVAHDSRVLVVVAHLLTHLTPHVSVRTVSDLVALTAPPSLELSNVTVEAARLCVASWTLLTSTTEAPVPRSTAATTHDDELHTRLCALSILAYLGLCYRDVLGEAPVHALEFWTRYLVLYDRLHSERELARLCALVALVPTICSRSSSLAHDENRGCCCLAAASPPLELVARLLASVGTNQLTTTRRTFIRAILALCDASKPQPQHLLSHFRSECLTLLSKSPNQTPQTHTRDSVRAGNDHVSLVTEVLAAAVQDHWAIWIVESVSEQCRVTTLSAMTRLAKTRSRLVPLAKVVGGSVSALAATLSIVVVLTSRSYCCYSCVCRWCCVHTTWPKRTG